LWYHAWLVTGAAIPAVNALGEAGFLGVDLFFFISGFCLFAPFARAQRDGRPRPSIRRFYLRRAVKIVPSYLLALAVFATVYHARFASVPDALVQIGSHLAFVHTLSPDTFGAISGPLWTIGVEVQFYVLFPLVALGFCVNPVLAYAALALVAEAYRLALGASGNDSTFWCVNQLPAYLDVFGAGMLAAYAFTRARAGERGAARTRVLTAVSIAACAAFVALLAFTSALFHARSMDAVYAWMNGHRFAIGPLFVVLALSTTFAAGRWRSIFAARVLAFLSLISYNVYLWNLEIAVWFQSAGLPPAVTFAAAVTTAIVLASAITYFIEKPILEADLPRLWAALRERFAATLTEEPTSELV
jgi:peptidoglycan/LPS O-acetylase OafA/YrhL